MAQQDTRFCPHISRWQPSTVYCGNGGSSIVAQTMAPQDTKFSPHISRWQPSTVCCGNGGSSIVAQTMAPQDTKFSPHISRWQPSTVCCGNGGSSIVAQTMAPQDTKFYPHRKPYSSCSKPISCQSRNLKIQESTSVTPKAVKWLVCQAIGFPLHTTTFCCPV